MAKHTDTCHYDGFNHGNLCESCHCDTCQSIQSSAKLDETEVSNLFQVFSDNCDNTMLRQTIRFNPEPEAVKAARLVLEHRSSKNQSNWRQRRKVRFGF